MATILLIEDDPADARLISEALIECQIPAALAIARDGYEAIDYLRRQSPFEHVPRPDLIVLDLNLPRLHGRSVLAMLKADPRLRKIPVVIVSTATSPDVIRECMALAADAYIPKAKRWDQIVASMRAIGRFLPGHPLTVDDSGAQPAG